MVANTLPAYFFGLAIGQLVYGPLSDRIGRKSLFILGLRFMRLQACSACSLQMNGA